MTGHTTWKGIHFSIFYGIGYGLILLVSLIHKLENTAWYFIKVENTTNHFCIFIAFIVEV